MPRLSQKKIINNKENNLNFFNKYINVIDGLQKKFSKSSGANFKHLVNFKNNKDLHRHSWYSYKQGYAENLVKEIIIKENPKKDYYVLDPFTGVGTTNLVAKSLGYKSIGFDINPVAFLASKVKNEYYSEDDCRKIKKIINNFKPGEIFRIEPEPKVILSSFEPISLNSLYRIKSFIENLEKKYSEKISNFFKLAYLSIIEDCSIRTKDGNGIKLNLKKKKIENVFIYFIERCKLMIGDVNKANFKSESIFINGSVTIDTDFKKIKNKKVGISIFSPPYANCFDYCEVYKLEFWLGGFVKTYDEFKKFREMAMRSHVNSKFNHQIKYKNSKVDIISKTISTFNIWNKNIPDMIRGYFDDMQEVLIKIKELSVPGAPCYIVVANSGYKGILVPTDLLIADIASNLGYKVETIMVARKIRSSSQQMNELHGKYDKLMRESIIVLRKK